MGVANMIVSNDAVAKFVSEELNFGLCPPYVAIGTERNGEIVNGVLLNHFEGSDVHISAAGTGWNKAILRAVGCYAYGMLGCERMTMITASEDVARYAERLGGKREGVLRNHFGPECDGLIVGILRDEFIVPAEGVLQKSRQ